MVVVLRRRCPAQHIHTFLVVDPLALTGREPIVRPAKSSCRAGCAGAARATPHVRASIHPAAKHQAGGGFRCNRLSIAALQTMPCPDGKTPHGALQQPSHGNQFPPNSLERRSRVALEVKRSHCSRTPLNRSVGVRIGSSKRLARHRTPHYRSATSRCALSARTRFFTPAVRKIHGPRTDLPLPWQAWNPPCTPSLNASPRPTMRAHHCAYVAGEPKTSTATAC